MSRKSRQRRRSDGPPVAWRVPAAVVAASVVLGMLGAYAVFRPGRPAPGPHPHPHPSHGGELVAVGDGDGHPHAEVVREPGDRVTLHLLDEDGSRVLRVAARTPAATLAAGDDREELLLMPRPWEDDPDGTTSRYGFAVPRRMRGRAVAVSVPALEIGGRGLPLEFELPPPSDQDGGGREADPTATPGGPYTAADIEANGGPAGQKYRGHRPAHHVRPLPGDRVCPVSRLKADPVSGWVVGGRGYAFCCPPCIDEFVRRAKADPSSVRPPGWYRKS